IPQEFEQEPSGGILETLAHQAPLCATRRLIRQHRKLARSALNPAVLNGESRVRPLECSSRRDLLRELSRQVRKEERSNAIFVGAFLLVEHPGIVPTH